MRINSTDDSATAIHGLSADAVAEVNTLVGAATTEDHTVALAHQTLVIATVQNEQADANNMAAQHVADVAAEPDSDFSGVTPGSFDGGSWWDTVTGAFFAGLGQGVMNILNGAQDSVIGLVNLGIWLSPGGQLASALGHPINIPSPDWSNGLVVQESDGVHGWSKLIGGESLITLITLGAGQIRHIGTAGEMTLNQAGRFRSPPDLSGVLKYNRRIYDEFFEAGGRLVRERSKYVLDDAGEQIFGRFSEAENRIYLYADSNMSTITEELIHYEQLSTNNLLGRTFTQRIREAISAKLEADAASILESMGFTPW